MSDQLAAGTRICLSFSFRMNQHFLSLTHLRQEEYSNHLTVFQMAVIVAAKGIQYWSERVPVYHGGNMVGVDKCLLEVVWTQHCHPLAHIRSLQGEEHIWAALRHFGCVKCLPWCSMVVFAGSNRHLRCLPSQRRPHWLGHCDSRVEHSFVRFSLMEPNLTDAMNEYSRDLPLPQSESSNSI